MHELTIKQAEERKKAEAAALEAEANKVPEEVKPPKILILGHGRHGKDSVAEALHHIFGLKFQSSSMFACERVIFDHFNNSDDLPSYDTPEECYADRSNYRSTWYDLIQEFNKDDQSRLAREILEEGDMYVGMRALPEYEASKDLFTHVVWVDASARGIPLEPEDSFTIPLELGNMWVIQNDRSLRDLHRAVLAFGKAIGLKPVRMG